MTPLEAALSALDSVSADLLIAAKCRALMRGYHERWKDDPWVSVDEEQLWHMRIIDPDTLKPKRKYTKAGKYDGLCIYAPTGKKYVRENKTSSDDISLTSDYWRMLQIDTQVSAYILAAKSDGFDADGVLYDVVKKPKTEPKRVQNGDTRVKCKGEDGKLRLITDAERTEANFGTIEEIRTSGTYFGWVVWSDGVEDGQTETPELYEARLTYEVLGNLDGYFNRGIVPRLDQDLVEYAEEMVCLTDVIMDAYRKNAHFRNPNACRRYGSTCRFLDICCGVDTPHSSNWVKVENVHSELPILDDCGGRSVLTNSRMKMFQSCRREEYLHYGIGIRKAGGEDKEALVFGSLFHEALEAYWKQLRAKGENVHSVSDQAELPF
jgi:hypothetical protein